MIFIPSGKNSSKLRWRVDADFGIALFCLPFYFSWQLNLWCISPVQINCLLARAPWDWKSFTPHRSENNKERVTNKWQILKPFQCRLRLYFNHFGAVRLIQERVFARIVLLLKVRYSLQQGMACKKYLSEWEKSKTIAPSNPQYP